MRYHPKKSRCLGCTKYGNASCKSLPFGTMPIDRQDGFDAVVLCTGLTSQSQKSGAVALENIERYDLGGNIRWREFVLPEAVKSLLGTVSDAQISRQTGIPKSLLAMQRKKLGVSRIIADPSSWGEKEISILGTMSDPKAAEILKCNLSTVSKKRLSLGIPSFRRVRRPQQSPATC